MRGLSLSNHCRLIEKAAIPSVRVEARSATDLGRDRSDSTRCWCLCSAEKGDCRAAALHRCDSGMPQTIVFGKEDDVDDQARV